MVMSGLVEVYPFPNGFRREAESMYGWLRHYNLTPSWGDLSKGSTPIMLPAHEVECLRMMQRGNPARFGNPPEVNEALEETRRLNRADYGL